MLQTSPQTSLGAIYDEKYRVFGEIVAVLETLEGLENTIKGVWDGTVGQAAQAVFSFLDDINTAMDKVGTALQVVLGPVIDIFSTIIGKVS